MPALWLLPCLPVGLSLLVLVVTHLQAWAFFDRVRRSPPTGRGPLPPASILVPLRGLDQDTVPHLRRCLEQDYPSPHELVVALENGEDPAVPAVRALQEEGHGTPLRLVFSDPLGLAARGKIANLIAAETASLHPLLLLLDGDVMVPPDALRQAAEALGPSEIGLVFAVPTCHGALDPAAALHNLSVNASAITYAATAFQGRTRGAVGSLMATRREVLDRIGGLACLADRLVGIDIGLARAIQAAGFAIGVLPEAARIHHARDTPGGLWWQWHRWMVTIRRDVPGFPLVVVVLGIPLWWALLLPLGAALTGRPTGFGITVVVLVLLANLVSAAVIDRRLVHDPGFRRWWPLAAVLELASFPVFLHSLLSRRVLWRGRWLELGPSDSRKA
jgi:ceramide glucosyltransferase